jgi:ribulose-phosphate 3-epimerase
MRLILPNMKLQLGIKSDPINYRYSFPWLFRLMADEGVTQLQLGSFFEIYQLPDSYFTKLKKQADDFGIRIDSLFTAHRELGGFFREDPEWVPVARRNYERFIEVGAILGARSVGSNPGALPRDLMGLKAEGTERFLTHFRELMHFAKERGVDWLTIEPMSCLAEPPTLPDEIRSMGDVLNAYHAANPTTTSRVGYCTDIAHGYIDEQGRTGFNHIELFEATLPYLYEVHLKNTDERFHSTFGFEPGNLPKGIVDVALFRNLLLEKAAIIPVPEITGYLEIGGPKLGRDYTDGHLESHLRESLRYLKKTFLEASDEPAPTKTAAAADISTSKKAVEIAPSMMCVDPLNFETALRQVEALGVDLLHLDVMDGRYVPNFQIGLGMLEQLARKTRLPLDVHLMVEDNDAYLALLEKIPLHQISIHAESSPHLDRSLARIRELGAKAGVALNPATPLETLEFILERIDYVLLMTVNPGFAGQVMTPASLRKIAACRTYLDERGYAHLPIQVDGNVSFANIPAMVAAGAYGLVAGTSSIFHTGASWSENLAKLHTAVAEGLARK